MIKQLYKVISKHKEWPSLDGTLNLESWNLKDNINDRFKNKEE